jgi:hypothetical protein
MLHYVSPPELLRSNVLLWYNGNEINKPLHSNGHVLIDAHVGGSHITPAA